MKRVFLIFGVLVAFCLVTNVQRGQAQTVTASAFAAKVSLLDGQITSGDTTSAKVTFATINTMMMQVLGVTKNSIYSAVSAGNDSLSNYYKSYLQTQQVPLYQNIWHLKADLVGNHTTLIAKLNSFDALIY